MKKRLFQFLLFAFILSLGSCVKDDIDDLQGQIDDLTEKVDEMEAAQQAALLAEIAKVETLIVALQSENSDLTDEYEALLTNLQNLENEVESNASSIFYGNVLTDDDFAAVLSQGATIITGKVVATVQGHIDALVNVKMIGSHLFIYGGTSVLFITEVNDADATVSLPLLKTVGATFDIKDNGGIVSVDAPEMVLIYEDLNLESNLQLASFNLSKLNLIGNELSIYEYNPNYGNGNLVNLDLSSTNVSGDVMVSYLGEGANLELGVLSGNLFCDNNGIDTLEILGTSFLGDLTISNNASLETILLPDMTRLEGDLTIESNKAWGWGTVGKLASLEAFDNIEYIGGNVAVRQNTFTTLDAFNNVTEVAGSLIELSNNGNEKTLVNVFNALETTGPSAYSHANITIAEKMDWFTGFTVLTKAKDVTLTMQKTQDANYEQGELCKADGFDAMTEVNMLSMEISDITEFNAFPVLNNLKKYGEYLYLVLPIDANVSLCSMSTLLTSVKNGDFDNQWNTSVKATFIDAMSYAEMDRSAAVDQLLATCN
jgi:hypothetical protein